MTPEDRDVLLDRHQKVWASAYAAAWVTLYVRGSYLGDYAEDAATIADRAVFQLMRLEQKAS